MSPATSAKRRSGPDPTRIVNYALVDDARTFFDDVYNDSQRALMPPEETL